MQRRDFLKSAAAAAIVGSVAPRALAHMIQSYAVEPGDAGQARYLYKMRHFNEPHEGDVFVSPEQYRVFESCVLHLERLARMAGHGKVGLLAWDEGLTIARDYPGEVGAFSRAETDFLEMIYAADATRYGFYGEKSLPNITDKIPSNAVAKVARSGHYIYRGRPLETYEKIRRVVGPQAILTSGVRGVMKQCLLFLRKAYDNGGNLSLASRSLAPPGFSFHGISDFDVGQMHFGQDNFTERFTTSQVYRRLQALGYLDLRYPRDNLLGVRFEPWHIRVDPKA